VSAYGYIEIKDWGKFQHYKDRNPPWIKLHAAVQDNYEFHGLPDASKAHLVGLWILASKLGNKVPADPQWIAARIGATEPVDLEALVVAGFIQPLRRASDLPQIPTKCAVPEGEAEAEPKGETERTAPLAADAVVENTPGQKPHDLGSCIGLVVEKLYFGNRPSAQAMRNEASIAKALGGSYGFDRLAAAIEGLARRREAGDLPNVGRRQVMSLRWLNSSKFELNQLAVSEDAFYRGDASPRKGRSGAEGIAGIIGRTA
jgi:hypothetical protein